MATRKSELSYDMKNIVEVTEEYNETIVKNQRLPSTQQNDPKEQNIGDQSQKRSLDLLCCLTFLKSLFKRDSTAENYQVNESEITKQIEKIKQKKLKKCTHLQPQSNPRKTLVLDLDDTLVHTSFKKPKIYDFSVEIDVRGQTQKAYVTKRFGLDNFLYEMSQLYEIILFTSSAQEYSQSIYKAIDPKKHITALLTREHCTILNNFYHIKNLQNLGRELDQTILVDDNPMSGALQPSNLYKIDPFYGSPKDRRLLRLGDFLKELAARKSIECIETIRKTFQTKKIRAVQLNHNLGQRSRICFTVLPKEQRSPNESKSTIESLPDSSRTIQEVGSDGL